MGQTRPHFNRGDGGAPTKCTPDLQEKFAGLRRRGSPIKIACKICRITEETYYNWRDRATTGEEPFHTFIQECELAHAEGIQANIDLWDEANKEQKDPRWIAKHLAVLGDIQEKEQTKKTELTVTGGIQVAPAFDTSKLTDEQFAQWCGLVELMQPGRVAEPEMVSGKLILSNTIEIVPD